MDDLNQSIPTSYHVRIDSTTGTANTYISNDGHLTITGKPGTEFNLILQTQNTRHVAVKKTGSLGECPLGFILENNSECVCSASSQDKQFIGIPHSDVLKF